MGYIWEDDDEFNRENIRRADLQNMSNEHHDMKVARFAISVGLGLLLYSTVNLFISAAGLSFLWFPLAIWIVFRLVDVFTLYRFRRQMASEFPSERWQDVAWRESEN